MRRQTCFATLAIATLVALGACAQPPVGTSAPVKVAETPPDNKPRPQEVVTAPPVYASTLITGTVQAPSGIIAAGAGNLIAAGAGNLRGSGTSAGIIAAGAGNLVSRGTVGLAERHTLASGLNQHPLANTEVFLADGAGNPIPRLPHVLTDTNGNYSIPNVPVGFSFVVVAKVKTKEGKDAGLRTLVKSTRLGSTADIDAGTNMVTASVVTGTGDIGDFNLVTLKSTAAKVDENLTDATLPDLSDNKAMVEKMATMAATIADIKSALSELKKDLSEIKASLAEANAKLAAQEKANAEAQAKANADAAALIALQKANSGDTSTPSPEAKLTEPPTPTDATATPYDVNTNSTPTPSTTDPYVKATATPYAYPTNSANTTPSPSYTAYPSASPGATYATATPGGAYATATPTSGYATATPATTSATATPTAGYATASPYATATPYATPTAPNPVKVYGTVKLNAGAPAGTRVQLNDNAGSYGDAYLDSGGNFTISLPHGALPQSFILTVYGSPTANAGVCKLSLSAANPAQVEVTYDGSTSNAGAYTVSFNALAY